MPLSCRKSLKNSKTKSAPKRCSSVASLKRKAWEKKLVAEHGEEWLEENKAMLDAQWKYITALGI